MSMRSIFTGALLLAGVLPALADGGSYEREPVRRKGVIEAIPSREHHYRDDMVEPGWRMYQQYPDYDPQAPLESDLSRRNHQTYCDPWRNACRPAQPWWTRR